jgi:hypothetical protein
MADNPKAPEMTSREQRLQAALRENLKRRKAQARERAERREGAGQPHDSAGIDTDKQGQV